MNEDILKQLSEPVKEGGYSKILKSRILEVSMCLSTFPSFHNMNKIIMNI